jgi:AAA+ ATPase superfamily predicted ATPase
MNPFSYGTVVKEPYFFDRKEEKERIISTLTGGNNLVLYAPRRYGKTSLVMNVIETLTSLGYHCIYFDFMTVYSRESYVEVFSKAIFKQQGGTKNIIETIAKIVKGIRPKLTFDHKGEPEFSLDFLETKISDKTIDEVIDLPEKLYSSGKRLIIIMDEFQDIEKLNGENFEKLLRSKIQHHSNVNYLFLGSRTHILQDMFNNKSPDSKRPKYIFY